MGRKLLRAVLVQNCVLNQAERDKALHLLACDAVKSRIPSNRLQQGTVQFIALCSGGKWFFLPEPLCPPRRKAGWEYLPLLRYFLCLLLKAFWWFRPWRCQTVILAIGSRTITPINACLLLNKATYRWLIEELCAVALVRLFTQRFVLLPRRIPPCLTHVFGCDS